MRSVAIVAVMVRITVVACMNGSLASVQSPQHLHLYVDGVSGSDEATGEHVQQPLRTLSAAQRAARAAGVPTTVHAGPGTYSPLSLNELDAGVRYQGVPGAIISAGVKLAANGFAAVPSADPVYGRLPTATRAGVERFDITPLGLPSSALGITDMQLSCGGEPMNLATWPSNGSWAHTGANVSSNGFVFPSDAPIPLEPTGLWLAGFFIYDWSDSRIPVESVVKSNHTLFADTTGASYVRTGGQFIPGARFRFLNLPEFLDTSGQFWLDRSTNYLYVMKQHGATCTLAVGAIALQLTNTAHVSIAGFSIESAATSVVSISDSSSIRLHNCSVRNGMVGISVTGGAGVVIADVEVQAIGGTGISILGGDRPTLTRGDHLVTNCTIHDFARINWCYHPGIQLEGVGNIASYNEIYNAPHQGILVGGNDQLITHNVFHDLLLESFDSGAIYKSDRDWTARGLVVSSNFFYNLGSTSPSDRCNPHTACCRHAIYMDATEHGFTATGNLIIQPPELASSSCNYGVFDNGGRNNIISGNLCVGYVNCVRVGDYNLIAQPAFSIGMLKNFVPYHYRSPPYSHYPGLPELDPFISLPLMGNCSSRESCGATPWHVSVTHNVAVLGEIGLGFYGANPPATLPRFNITDNLNITFATADFQNPHPGIDNCWDMRSTSSVLSSGFQRIRPDLMGPPAFQSTYAIKCGEGK